MVNFTLQTCLSSASNANTPRYEQVEKLSLCRNLQLSHRAQTSDRCAVARLDMSSVLCKKSSTQRRSLVHSHNHCTAVLVGGMWQRGSNVLFNVREGGVQFGLELLHSMSSQWHFYCLFSERLQGIEVAVAHKAAENFLISCLIVFMAVLSLRF